MHHQIRDFSFSFEELNITTELLEEFMGYLPQQSPEPFPDMIHSALSRGAALCQIKGSIAISRNFSVNEKKGSFKFENLEFETNRKLISQLSGSMGAVIFICTAGPLIEEESRLMMAEGDFLEGYILDSLGSVTVEAAIEKIQDILLAEFEQEGLKLTNRFSPGYCGWALVEQRKIFSLFPEKHCAIKLSDSCLMEPVKSVSGIIGFGPQAVKHLHECQLCELETCTYRTIRIARQK
jgi:hypothetical protein